ncbi:hypothetical protein DFQ27_009619 [Actinomortierella ambigua]|uniref:Uncharacterized protein n=1 Tax=Actinomortierella ambigua TaxID=1343610 RepID=A0A9P6UAR8_9FUNG|nr:hypothetical protein DFQ27_009619 [Actinomortierella ambigua]
MKTRFSSLDVRATVATLQETIVNLRLQNVYDVNSRTYLFKFSLVGVTLRSQPDKKETVVIESGIRLHTTQFARDKSITPSVFCNKLRKHLRARRLTAVKQLGTDRIVDFEFGADALEHTYHVIAEFYAAGNIILTDGEYRILAILRVVQPSEKVKMAVGEIYDVSKFTRTFQPVDKENVTNYLKKAGPKDMLKKLLNSNTDYGPALAEHAIVTANLSPNTLVATGFDTSDGSPDLEALYHTMLEADQIMEGKGNLPKKGYIIMQVHKKKNPEDENEEELVTYDEFHPYLFAQHTSRTYREFASFDAAVDEFFSAIESQKLEVKRRSQEEHAQQKLDTVKMEHFARIKGLEETQRKNVLRAELIESNLEICDQAIMIIRNAVATGMDWKDLADLVEEEKRHGNPIALMIDSLKLDSNQVCVILADPFEEDVYDEEADQEDMEEEDRNQPMPKDTMLVDLDIGLSAFANARNYYGIKKQSAVKHEKTMAHATKAFKSAEKKIWQDLKDKRITTTIQRMRKPYWFEKFMWFITSENYLVIAGRDMQQNEMIVKRYMKKNDIYVHADIHGAATVVVKNPSDQPVPPNSLFQAGIMSICQSKAWDNKVVTSAFWVHADQVSKTAPSGEYLTTGSFMIRGKKNFLPPVQLVYGFGFLFKLDEQSIGNHLNERRALRIDGEGEGEGAGNADQAPNRPDSDLRGTDAKKADAEGEDVSLEGDDSDSDDDDEASVEHADNTADKETSTRESSAEPDDAEDADKQEEGDDEEDEDEEESEAESSDEDEAFPDTQIQFVKRPAADITTAPSSADKGKGKPTRAVGDTAKSDKYSLEDYGHDSQEEEEKAREEAKQAGGGKNQGKAYISAKMRRDMKKGKLPGSEGGGDGTGSDSGASSLQQSSSRKTNEKKQANAQPTATAAPKVRGKKGKSKKIKDKYADQDEEERQLRIELLAPDKGPQPKGKRAKREAEKKAAEAAKRQEDEKKYNNNKQQQPYHKQPKGGKANAQWKPEGELIGRKPPQAVPTLEGPIGSSSNAGSGAATPVSAVDPDELTEAEVLKRAKDAQELEEVRQLLEEENIKLVEPEEMENLTVLDQLTSQPIPGDILHFAVPVCAPYTALQKFKYKVKVTPGSMKRGKAVKLAVDHMVGGGGASAVAQMEDGPKKEALAELEHREKELIKMVKDDELINAMMSKSKISAPGVETTKKKGAKAKGKK